MDVSPVLFRKKNLFPRFLRIRVLLHGRFVLEALFCRIRFLSNDFQTENACLRILFVLFHSLVLLSLSPFALSFSLSPSSQPVLFVPLISKQTSRLEDDSTDPFRICEEQRQHRRHRPPICSAEKSASRTDLINVNLALSEIAQSTSARFMMKTLRIIAFTYNVYRRQCNNFYAMILLGDYIL